jgi:hypothetical protein
MVNADGPAPAVSGRFRTWEKDDGALRVILRVPSWPGEDAAAQMDMQRPGASGWVRGSSPRMTEPRGAAQGAASAACGSVARCVTEFQ